MNVRLQDDDVQICRAHERIHALNREILLHGDTAAQANQRIAYLNDLWKGGSDAEFSSKESRRSSRMYGVFSFCVLSGRSDFLLKGLAVFAFFGPLEIGLETILSQAATILEKISSSTTVPDGSRLESARLAYELRNFTNRLKSSESSKPFFVEVKRTKFTNEHSV
ncbi:unnamed protein product [Nippostrongylus brasiliensis]|uniref:Uncharacterized protein n=1 Tax=Nippostrongylus brasiliensis TaxID=27835 RepID=A0A0N4XXN2_NIPBR|nr:unnamed protein product [Nippostrongylus brasiliensis]